jgi:lysophospholipase L1-like esterase
VRLVNTFGKGPLHVRDVHVARRTSGSSIDGATDRALLFGGLADVTIAPGQFAVSDAADFAVPELADVTVSFFVVTHDGATCHSSAFQTNYVAGGDVAANPALAGVETNGSYFFLSNLDVLASDVTGAVVTLGASITDGYSAPGDANRRWPNDLAVRAAKAGLKIGVLNQGISGDGAVNASARFARDVVSQPGVRWVIFADCPVNDLGNGNPPAATEIDRIKALITAAHAAGLTFLCATLTPFEGAGYWSADKETGRAAINAFIRGAASGCDGVIDLDAATHDPAHPTRYLPAYDAGDHLHPNADGLQAIADAVRLDLLR